MLYDSLNTLMSICHLQAIMHINRANEIKTLTPEHGRERGRYYAFDLAASVLTDSLAIMGQDNVSLKSRLPLDIKAIEAALEDEEGYLSLYAKSEAQVPYFLALHTAQAEVLTSVLKKLKALQEETE